MGPVDWSTEEDRFMDELDGSPEACVMWDTPDTDVADDNTLDGF